MPFVAPKKHFSNEKSIFWIKIWYFFNGWSWRGLGVVWWRQDRQHRTQERTKTANTGGLPQTKCRPWRVTARHGPSFPRIESGPGASRRVTEGPRPPAEGPESSPRQQTINQSNDQSNKHHRISQTSNDQQRKKTTKLQRSNLIFKNKQLPIDRPRRLLCYGIIDHIEFLKHGCPVFATVRIDTL